MQTILFIILYLDSLYERFKSHISPGDNGMDTAELEEQLKQSNLDVRQIGVEMQSTANNLSAQVDEIQQGIKKQNVCIFLIMITTNYFKCIAH